jgi:phosphate transport system protein
MASSHIVKSYDKELTAIVETIARMGGLVEQQFAAAIQAIHARDNEIAGRAFASDTAIDELEHALNQLALKVLALRQPMASDLRLIIGSMKIARDLERMGDYAANLAKRARTLNVNERMAVTSTFLRMANLVAPVLHDVIDAYTQEDVAKADAAYASDDAIDDAYNALVEDLIRYMQEHPEHIKTCTHLLFMAKNMERIGDRATNVAETVHFIVSGELPAVRKKKALPPLTENASA